ncbi:MAG: hypothetical protein U1D30_23275 [Planctomycetota bacterium]
MPFLDDPNAELRGAAFEAICNGGEDGSKLLSPRIAHLRRELIHALNTRDDQRLVELVSEEDVEVILQSGVLLTNDSFWGPFKSVEQLRIDATKPKTIPKGIQKVD